MQNFQKQTVPLRLESRFHLNGHTLGIHPQTQKLEQHLWFGIERVQSKMTTLVRVISVPFRALHVAAEKNMTATWYVTS